MDRKLQPPQRSNAFLPDWLRKIHCIWQQPKHFHNLGTWPVTCQWVADRVKRLCHHPTFWDDWGISQTQQKNRGFVVVWNFLDVAFITFLARGEFGVVFFSNIRTLGCYCAKEDRRPSMLELDPIVFICASAFPGYTGP
eukprot:s702_g54.t1